MTDDMSLLKQFAFTFSENEIVFSCAPCNEELLIAPWFTMYEAAEVGEKHYEAHHCQHGD